MVVTEVTEGEARDGATDHIPDRDIVDECDRKAKDKRLGGHLRVPDLDGDGAEDEHGDEDDRVPPLEHLREARHEAGVDVRLLRGRVAGSDPDLLAEVKESVRERSR